MWHKKMLNRLADIFLTKEQKEGVEAAQEWEQRTLNQEIIKELIPVVQKKRAMGLTKK